MDFTDAPGYLQGADLHNIGSGTPSFFSDLIANVAGKLDSLGNVISDIPDFAVSSIASGINSIYNSGVVVGNFFGLTDADQNDLQTTLGSLDSNLGDYYAQNKQLVDTAGFIAGSFAPGIGGIKLFNTGQRLLSDALRSGGIGRTLAEATGLIPTLTSDGLTLTQVAGKALAQSQGTFSALNAGVLKAIGGGFAQATWESAAFEAMVQATMFKSPVLENQSIGDIGANILVGGALGGVIGGAINSAKIYGDIKKVITAADLEAKPFTLRSSQFGMENEPANRIIVGANDLAATPDATDAATTALRNQRVTALQQEQRAAIHQMVPSDPAIGNVVADAAQGMEPDQVAKVFQGAQSISRPGTLGKIVDDPESTVGYVKLHGENTGDVTFDPPSAADLTLADQLKDKAAVDQFVNSAKFTPAKPWSMATASSMNEIEARYIWAENTAKYTDGMTIHSTDIPLQEGALRNQIQNVNITDGVHSYNVNNLDDLANEVVQNKLALVNELGKAQKAGWNIASGEGQITSSQIARAANVSVKAIENQSEGAGASMFARQDAQAAYDAMRAANGLSQSADTNLNYIPRHAAVVYKTTGLADANSDLVSALTNVEYAKKIQQEASDRAFAGIAGDMQERFVHPGDSAILKSNRYGAGAGLVSFSNGSYGTLGSWAELIGKATSELMAKLKGNTSAVMDSAALKLRLNQKAAIEFDKIRNLVSSSTEKYVLNDSGDGLIAAKAQEYRAAIKAGQKNVAVPELQAGAPEEIKFIDPDAGEAIIAHMEASGSRTQHQINLRNSVGLTDNRDPNAYYPHKPDPKSMPYFAFVKNETVAGAGLGHTSMIHAASPEELESMINMARQKTGFTVYTKSDAEDFYKAQQSYEFDRTLHENYIDSSLKSAGVNNQFFPKTDPDAIVDEWLKWHAKADDILAREAVSTKFGHEFDQLGTLGEQYTNIAGSRYATNIKNIEATAQNPYNDYRKTALNISRLGEYPLLSAFNRNLESGVDSVYQKIVDAWSQAKDVNDLQKVNAALEAAGVNHSFKNSAEIILANHSAPKPYLSNFIRGANAILSNTFLRLDPLNALNNAIGAQVLFGHETSGEVKALLRDASAAGITVPGTQDTILSTGKLVGKALNAWFSKLAGNQPELDAMFRKNGWTTKLSDQYKSMMDDLTLSGTENPAQLNTALSKAMAKAKELTEKGETLTGNKLAEEFNRFVTAHVGKQISDLRIAHGLMEPDGQLAYINTFVNRTQGNNLASQRPLIFQGPIGQAVGLFQTYQFNVMQQLFRGVSEGSAKDAAMLMGLQGTMYGLNGLPGFQFINQHIIGTASGNTQHTDAYSALYGTLGKTAGDWLMYGIPSNMLQTNIYSRGDINPRTLTVIPTNPADIVAVSAFGKFASNLYDTLHKIAGGSDVWQTVLQGIEHNTLSRPLAGLAQTLQATSNPEHQVFSTTNAGDISFTNDFLSLATLSRLAGGKPLDEALANDEVSRAMVYKAADHARMKSANEAFKTSVIGAPGSAPPEQAVQDYMAAFVKNGGRQEQFSQNMLHSMTQANTPRANQIIATLKGPYAQHMKDLMGGGVQGLSPDSNVSDAGTVN